MTDSPKAHPGKEREAPSPGMDRRQALVRLAGLAAVAVLDPASLVLAVEDPLATAQGLLDAGRIEDAIDRLRRVTAEDPRNERAYVLLGRACAMADRPAEALRAFRMALRLNPADTHTRMLADLLAQHPLAGRAVPGDRGGRHGPSRQERAALAEREAFLSGQGGRPARKGRFRLVLDAGHGGPDPGGIGASGLREKDVTLDLALRAAREMQAGGGDLAVFLTRLSDVSMSQAARAACADLYGADLFVSLHAPFLEDGSVSGLFLFAPQGANDRETQRVATAVAGFENRAAGMAPGFSRAGSQGLEAGIVRAAGAAGRLELGRRYAGALREALGQGPFAGKGAAGSAGLSLLSEANVPAVCLVTGFVSNAGDEAVLADAGKRGELAAILARTLAAVAASPPV